MCCLVHLHLHLQRGIGGGMQQSDVGYVVPEGVASPAPCVPPRQPAPPAPTAGSLEHCSQRTRRACLPRGAAGPHSAWPQKQQPWKQEWKDILARRGELARFAFGGHKEHDLMALQHSLASQAANGELAKVGRGEGEGYMLRE